MVVMLVQHNEPGLFHHCNHCKFMLAICMKICQQPADGCEFPLSVLLQIMHGMYKINEISRNKA